MVSGGMSGWRIDMTNSGGPMVTNVVKNEELWELIKKQEELETDLDTAVRQLGRQYARYCGLKDIGRAPSTTILEAADSLAKTLAKYRELQLALRDCTNRVDELRFTEWQSLQTAERERETND
jgi:hypothetical protein